ncbi:Partner of Y14 and-like protein [Hapsidospora chrysogenum ATCC 11550]|uniref:Partner of Y14 and-like protein n=1 Tax=Hapsidospora chrysogenum (strain ATCC 11550 / CBS 779.69 / DSM 880 / IAM 14645 / JCM 23072 / IMI 49137) TaxID=857340 RepID=A0A086SUV1_HAPC1|nr:Partner of Y14 and-like protein [Hapsidospora chrysogenum ATCC 11550]
MPSQPGQASNAGIVTDEASGQRHIPESVRADGSTRKAIKVRPGYRPPEDVEVYKNRTAEAFRERGKRIGIPGAAGIQEEKPDQSASAASNKNAKRREARKKAKAGGDGDGNGAANGGKQETQPLKQEERVDPEVEREKKARNLKKKLKQAKDLQSKREGGESLLPEQIAKVIKINELIRELEGLGFDAEGEPKSKSGEVEDKTGDDKKV